MREIRLTIFLPQNYSAPAIFSASLFFCGNWYLETTIWMFGAFVITAFGLPRSVVVQSLSCACLFVTPWTAAHQASLSFTISEFAQAHVHWISDAVQTSHPLAPSSCPQSFPASGSFPVSCLFTSGGQKLELQLQSFQWMFGAFSVDRGSKHVFYF